MTIIIDTKIRFLRVAHDELQNFLAAQLHAISSKITANTSQNTVFLVSWTSSDLALKLGLKVLEHADLKEIRAIR